MKRETEKETKNSEGRTTREPRIFVVSGPGGAGKTTLVNQLLKEKRIQNHFIKGISVTTRKRRPQEADGKDYFFVTKEEFSRLEKKKFFLESQKVLGDSYGTPRLFYILAKKKKKGLILCIDVKGGMYLGKKSRGGKIITIFITAPTKEELCQRMEKRAESKGAIRKRTNLAKKELQFSKYYDYLITNQNIESALEKLQNIVLTHH